jgi:hypothetical protein
VAKQKGLSDKQFSNSIYELNNYNEIEDARDAIFQISVLIGNAKISPAQNVYLLRSVADAIEKEIDGEVSNSKPRFGLREKVKLLPCGSPLDEAVGTIVRVPKKRGQKNSIFFPGGYAYDVDFSGRVQRIAEDHLEPVLRARAAKAGK